MNIKKLLIKQAKQSPDKSAIVFKDEVITFSQLKDTSFRFANYLLKSDIKKSDKVAMLLANIPEAIFSFLGIFSVGAIVVPLDFMLTENEVINFINHSEVKILITQPKKDINLANIKNSCPTLEDIVVCKERIEGFSFWGTILEESQADEPGTKIEQNSLSSIFYTSGSTGHPKGVMLNYQHLSNPAKAIDYFLKVSGEDVFLCGGVPFSHLGGLVYILLMLRFSSTLILMKRFQPLEFLKNIEQHKVTIFCIVPAMYVAILSLKEYDKFDLLSLRYAVVFGAPSSPALLKKFHQVCPNAYLSNGWGMTETAAPNCMLLPGAEKIQSIGKFTPDMEAKIVDEKGICLGPNEQGELWVKGKAVMRGYYRQDGLTEKVLTKEGWLRTGDISYYDEEGLFYIVGRKKDMIKVAGEIVFPAEVEEKIYCHPKVKEAAVIGVSDSLRGEVPKAFIAVAESQALEEQELRGFLKEHLAQFKIPHYFEFVGALPKNRTGKIDKTKLKLERRQL